MRLASLVAATVLAAIAWAVPPTDNPVAARYKDNAAAVPAWVNALPWDRAVSVADMAGATDDARFAAAQAAVVAKGGGVIFFPAGTYSFADSLVLENGVILRGETPKLLDAKDPRYTLATRFEFPTYRYTAEGNGTPIDTAFKQIRLKSARDCHNVGIVNIAINRAHIYCEEDAEHQTGKGRFVFGCVLTNAASADPTVPNVDYGHLPHQRWTARHRAAIHLFGEDLFVANNRIPKSGDDNFLMRPYRLIRVRGKGQDFNIKTSKLPYDVFTIEEGVEFDYDNRPGIYANPFGIGGFGREHVYGTPETHPYGFRKGTIIRDNYLYNTGRCAIHFTGDGTYVGFNTMRFPEGLRRPTTTGLVISDGSATNDNRAVYMRGWRWTLEGNDYQVYPNIAYDGRMFINDGEGLSHENHQNSAVKDSAIVRNVGNRYLCLWVMDIDGLRIEDNVVTAPKHAIWVLGDTRTVKNLTVRNNLLTRGDLVVTTQDGHDITIEGNRFIGEGEGNLFISNPAWVKAANPGFALRVSEFRPKP